MAKNTKNQKPKSSKKTARRSAKKTVAARRSTKKVTRREASAKKKEGKRSVKNVQVRVSPHYYGKIHKKAAAAGHKTTASYVRTLIERAVG